MCVCLVIVIFFWTVFVIYNAIEEKNILKSLGFLNLQVNLPKF